MSKRILVNSFDTETTGVEGDDRVIEFASSVFDPFTGEVVYRFEHRFNSGGKSIHPKAEAVHHISMSDIVACPDFATCIPTLRKIAKVAPVWIAHNAQFDVRMMANEFKIAGEKNLDIIVADSMSEGRWATPNGKNPNLGELCFAVGVDYDPSAAHAALYDTDVLAKAWSAGFQRGFFKLPEGFTTVE